MMHKDTIQLYELIVAMHEGDITDAQFAILNKKLQNKALSMWNSLQLCLVWLVPLKLIST